MNNRALMEEFLRRNDEPETPMEAAVVVYAIFVMLYAHGGVAHRSAEPLRDLWQCKRPSDGPEDPPALLVDQEIINLRAREVRALAADPTHRGPIADLDEECDLLVSELSRARPGPVAVLVKTAGKGLRVRLFASADEATRSLSPSDRPGRTTFRYVGSDYSFQREQR